MKKPAVTALLLFVLAVSAAVAADFPFDLSTVVISPVRPDIMAQGGSFTGIAHGYDALFTNPAGFARRGGSLTLIAPSLWLYGRPDRFSENLSTVLDKGLESVPDIIREHTENYRDEEGNRYQGGGFGAGTSAGIGFVGGGIGIGMALTAETFLAGSPFPLGLDGYVRANLTFVGGFAIPFNLLGVRFSAGGDGRYFIQSLSPLSGTEALKIFSNSASDPAAILGQISSWNGYGLAFDAGLMAEKGPFSFGLSLRDLLGTRVEYAEDSMQDVLDSLSRSASLPDSQIDYSSPDAPGTIPFSMNVGLGFHPDLGRLKAFFDPTIHAEISDVTSSLNTEGSFLTRLHAGASVKLLSFIELMGGLNQGYITMGAGVKLLFLDVSAAVFTRELGDTAGERPGSGAVVEAALRF